MTTAIIKVGDNKPSSPMSNEEFQAALVADEARLRAEWIAAGHPPEKFFYTVVPPPQALPPGKNGSDAEAIADAIEAAMERNGT